jgi:hypothetical protein
MLIGGFCTYMIFNGFFPASFLYLASDYLIEPVFCVGSCAICAGACMNPVDASLETTTTASSSAMNTTPQQPSGTTTPPRRTTTKGAATTASYNWSDPTHPHHVPGISAASPPDGAAGARGCCCWAPLILGGRRPRGHLFLSGWNQTNSSPFHAWHVFLRKMKRCCVHCSSAD